MTFINFQGHFACNKVFSNEVYLTATVAKGMTVSKTLISPEIILTRLSVATGRRAVPLWQTSLTPRRDTIWSKQGNQE